MVGGTLTERFLVVVVHGGVRSSTSEGKRDEHCRPE